MSNFLFHNKFHRSNHHTVSSFDYTDSAIDPIASQNEPFRGIFYDVNRFDTTRLEIDVRYIQTFAGLDITTFNGASAVTIDSIFLQLTGSNLTNSYQWWSTYTYVRPNSSSFGLYPTTYNTTNALSSSWNLAYDTYTNSNANSSTFNSYSITTSALSASWPFLNSALRIPHSQSNTRAKVFTCTNLNFVSNSAYWSLSSMQVAFAYITGGTIVKNIEPVEDKKRGGIYTLILQQDGFGSHWVEFEGDYVFAVPLSASALDTDTEIVSLTALSVTVIRFVCDGDKLYGKPSQYFYQRDAIHTYFQGDGIRISPNPAELYIQEQFTPVGGIAVQGFVLPLVPYTEGVGITILSGVPGT